MTTERICDFFRYDDKCIGKVRVPLRGFYKVCDRHVDQHVPPEDFSQCEGSGSAGHAGEIRFIADPFAAEIHDDYTEYWLCDSCAYESSMEI